MNDKSEFTKKDLKSGMMVELRNKQRYIVLLNASSGDLLVNISMVFNSVQKTYGVMILYNYGDNLIPSFPNSKPYGNDTDITKVFNFAHSNDALDSSRYILIWERPEEVELATAYKSYRKRHTIQSVETKRKFNSICASIAGVLTDATDEEIDSTWIILKEDNKSD